MSKKVKQIPNNTLYTISSELHCRKAASKPSCRDSLIYSDLTDDSAHSNSVKCVHLRGENGRKLTTSDLND